MLHHGRLLATARWDRQASVACTGRVSGGTNDHNNAVVAGHWVHPAQTGPWHMNPHAEEEEAPNGDEYAAYDHAQ